MKYCDLKPEKMSYLFQCYFGVRKRSILATALSLKFIFDRCLFDP
jgi:hypothetical protein